MFSENWVIKKVNHSNTETKHSRPKEEDHDPLKQSSLVEKYIEATKLLYNFIVFSLLAFVQTGRQTWHSLSHTHLNLRV